MENNFNQTQESSSIQNDSSNQDEDDVNSDYFEQDSYPNSVQASDDNSNQLIQDEFGDYDPEDDDGIHDQFGIVHNDDSGDNSADDDDDDDFNDYDQPSDNS